jgi:hypothetical protein
VLITGLCCRTAVFIAGFIWGIHKVDLNLWWQ